MFCLMTVGILFGISIFFLGLLLMNHSFTLLFGNRLKKYIRRSTSNPLLGVLTGLAVTALTQSSSGTTVMTVSLVNSGVMNLYQAAPVIMGANIGTTITGQLIAFNFFSAIPKILFLGVLLYSLNITSFSRYLGKFLIGFACLFLGIRVMNYSLDPLKYMIGFKELIISVENQKIKGIALGAAITAIIQSSSTAIAIIQGLAHGGLINIYCAAPVILGLNIGTCATTLISGLASDKNGKRAAVIHLLFNIIGTVIFCPFLTFFSRIIYTLTPNNPIKQVSNYHSLFNILSTIVLFPFISLMVKISKKIIR